ncbi:MAG: group III truncated hemoglobin [Chloroflexota bacterium]
MKDIEDIDDIQRLVDTFYQRVQQDEMLAETFDAVDWPTHLPRMVNFWATVIFHQPRYKGNPLSTHMHLSQQKTITPEHFSHWVILFQRTVDDLFSGQRAISAKQSAAKMERGLTHNLFERVH